MLSRIDWISILFFSVTFVWTLASTQAGVSTIIPVTNGLKFFITYLAGKYICHEEGSVFSLRAFSGLTLIGIGVILQLVNSWHVIMNFKSNVISFAIPFISMLHCYYYNRIFTLLIYNWDYSFHKSFMMINIQTTYILSDNIYFEAIKTVIRMLVCKYTQILSINRQMCFYPFDFHLLLR